MTPIRFDEDQNVEMHNKHVRNWVIFSIVFLYVIVAKDELINAVFSMWVGAWAMARIFKYLFNSANLTLDKFIPRDLRWTDLLFESTRKPAALVLVWWAAGILAALSVYKLLNIILIR